MTTEAPIVRSFLVMIAALGLSFFPAPSSAHPMGNFSISHYAGIHLEQGFVELHYLIDMAEIPTFQELQQNDLVAQADDPRVRSYLSHQAEALRNGLFLTLNGRRLLLEIVSQEILFSPGAGDLLIMKFGLVYRAPVSEDCISTRCELEYRDGNFPGRAGWKEVTASPSHEVTIERSSASARDRSNQLSNYPTDLINSPCQDLGAKVIYSIKGPFDRPLSAVAKTNSIRPTIKKHSVTTGASAATGREASAPIAVTSSNRVSQAVQLVPNQQATPRNSFTELMAAKRISFFFVLIAAAIAAGLGALHALEPGHGKTIVAAYLIGSRGTARHAFLLGMIVTVSHTAGVYFLGVITLYAQKYILPDRIYPFLAVLSGILIVGMGCYLFLQRYIGGEFAHSHGDGAFSRGKALQEIPQQPARKVSAGQLLVLGVTGGIVPCPAALVVLLSAAALHRTGFGLFLIVAFSLGLAAVLIAMGLAAVYARRILSRLRLEGALIQRWLPMGSAAMIIFLGFSIAIRGLMSAGLVQLHL